MLPDILLLDISSRVKLVDKRPISSGKLPPKLLSSMVRISKLVALVKDEKNLKSLAFPVPRKVWLIEKRKSLGELAIVGTRPENLLAESCS